MDTFHLISLHFLATISAGADAACVWVGVQTDEQFGSTAAEHVARTSY